MLKTDPREETALLRQDWEREKSNLKLTLRQIQNALAEVDTSVKSEQIEKVILLEKNIRKYMEDKERSLYALERNSCLLSRQQRLDRSYAAATRALQWWGLGAYGFIPPEDLTKWDISHIIADIGGFIPADQEAMRADKKLPPYLSAVYLQSILTDWQVAAGKIIEQELLAPRRIGSICFFSKENGLLGMKLGFMARIGLIDPDPEKVKIFQSILGAWNQGQRGLPMRIAQEDRVSFILSKYANTFESLFLDSGILRLLEEEHPVCYSEVLADLESSYPFLIFLLKKNQVDLHREALKNMIVDVHSLAPQNSSQKLMEEDFSSLLIARRRSRNILHYARDPWDIIVRDFGWNASPSLEDPLPAQTTKLPNPFHLSEKILLASQFALRVVSTSLNKTKQCQWVSQRESACWKKFGGKIPEIPRVLSENRTNDEWKIVLQLGEGNWNFSRNVPFSAEHKLAQAQALLQTLAWFRKNKLFLNNIRLDILAINGPEIRLLALDRLNSQETEDTISSLLWLWYDIGQPRSPLRPWPIDYFPDKMLSKIPEPLQKIAKRAASYSTLDSFLENLPPLNTL